MILQSEQINELAAALAKAQAEIKNPEKRKTARAGSYTYKYADIADGLTGILPILAKHGLSVTQPTAMEDGVIMLHTRLMHSSGQWIEGVYPVCPPGKHQDMGGAMTYSRRYSLFSIVGVAGEEDTDGVNAADASNGRQGAAATVLGEDTLSKAKSRPVYETLIKEMRAITERDALTKWGLENTGRIYSMHEEFQRFFRNDYGDHLTAILEGVTEDGSPLKAQLKESLEAEPPLSPLEAG